jgi:hypothetical protein
VADTREILLKLLGKETVSDAAKKAARGLDHMGDAADDAERDTKGLNKALEETHRTLTRLKDQARRSDDPLSFTKDINKQQRNLNNLTTLFADVGDDSASGFGAKFVARVGPVLAHAPIAPPLIAAAAAATPGIAAVLSAGVLAGLSGGVVAAGVRAAFNDPAVQAEGKSFAAELSQTLSDSTRSFVPATINGLKIIRGEVRKLGPELKEIGDVGASFVAPITRGVTDLVRRAIPGIKDALQESAPVVRSLERGLGQVGDAAGDALDSIGDGADGAALAIGDLLTVAAMGVREVGRTVGSLTKVYTFLRAATAIDKKAFAADMATNAAASAQFEAELQKLVNGFRGEGAAAAAAAREVRTLAEATRELADTNRTAVDSEIAFEEAIDNAAAAAKENGKTIDTNTAKGRANMQALSDLAAATLENVDATQTATHSQHQVNAAMQRGYEQFIVVATAMTGSAAKARELAGVLGLIPPTTKTEHKDNSPAAKARAEALRRKLLEVDGQYNANIKVNTGSAFANIAALRAALRNLRGATVDAAVTAKAWDKGRASGGPVSAGRTYLVGEKGPELLSMGNQGGHITPNHRLGQARGGGSDARAFATALRGVQVVLDGRVVGRLEGQRADLLERGG